MIIKINPRVRGISASFSSFWIDLHLMRPKELPAGCANVLRVPRLEILLQNKMKAYISANQNGFFLFSSKQTIFVSCDK